VNIREGVRAWLPVIVAGGALVAGGLVAIPLGGWDTVQLQSAIVPEQQVGEPYAGHRLSTAIDDVYLTDEHPNGYDEPEPGETFLVVVATMENLRDEPQASLGSANFYAFTIPGVVELGTQLPSGSYHVRLVRDGTSGSTLNPGVPDTVMFTFRVSSRLFAGGDEVRIGLTDAIPESADLYDGIRWRRPHVAVEVPITIRDER